MEIAFRDAGFNITSEQFTILVHLWYQDGLSQQAIATAVDRDKTTVSRVLNNMIKQKFVKRVPGDDKRERLIFLTTKGKSVQHLLVTISGSIYMKAIDNLSRKELLVAIKTLNQMTKNLS